MTRSTPTTIVLRGKDETGKAFTSVKKELSALPVSAQKATAGLGKAFDSVRMKVGPALGNAAKEGLGKLQESVARSAKALQGSLGGALKTTQAAAKETNTQLDLFATTTDKVTPSVAKLSEVADGKLAKALRNVAKEAKASTTPISGLTGVAQNLATNGFSHLATIALNVLAPGLGTVANIALKTLAPALTAVGTVAGKVAVAALTDLGKIVLRVVGPPLQKLATGTLKLLRGALLAVGKAATTLAKNALVGVLRAAAATTGLAIVGLAKALDATLGRAIREVALIVSTIAKPAFDALSRTTNRVLTPAFKALQPVTKVLGAILKNTLIPVMKALGTVAQSAARALNQWTGVSDAVSGALVRLGKEFTRITAVANKFQVVFNGVGKVAQAVARGQFKEISGILKETRTELDQVATSAQESFREWSKSVDEFNKRIKGLETATKAGTTQLDLFGNQATTSANELDKVEDVAERSHRTFDEYARAQRSVTKQLDLLGNEANSASPKIKQLADRIGETGIRAKGIIGSGTGRLNAYIKSVGNSAKTASGNVRGLAGAFGILQSAVPILSIGVVVDRLRELFTSAGQVNLQLSRLQQQSGISATTLDTFAGAARRLGYDIGEVEGFMETLVERVQEAQEGTGEGAEVFKILNIAIKDAGGELRSVEDIMFDYAKTISSITDQTEAAAFNTRLFGADGFRLGSAFAAISETAGKVDEDLEAMLERTQDLNDSWNDLLSVTLANARALGNVFTPALKVVVDALTALGQAAAFWGQFVFGSTRGTEEAAKALLGYNDAVKETSDEFVTFRHRLNLADEELDGLADTTKEVIGLTNDKAGADNNEAIATKGKTVAQAGYTQALRKVLLGEKERIEIYKEQLSLETQSVLFLRERIKTFGELSRASASQSNAILDAKNEELRLEKELDKAYEEQANQRARGGKISAAILQQTRKLEGDLYQAKVRTNQLITVTRTNLGGVKTSTFEVKKETEEVAEAVAKVGTNFGTAKDKARELGEEAKAQQMAIGDAELARFQQYQTNLENTRVIEFNNANAKAERDRQLHIARLGYIDLERARQIAADLDSFTRRKAQIENQEKIEDKQHENYVGNIRKQNEEIRKQESVWETVRKKLKEGVQGAISGLLKGTQTWGDALRNIGQSILDTLIKKFAQLATNSIFNIFSGGKNGLGSLFGGAGAALAGGLGKGGAAVGGAAAGAVGGIGKALGAVAGALGPIAIAGGAVLGISKLLGGRGESRETKRTRDAVTGLDESAILRAARIEIQGRIRRPSGGSHPNSRERRERREAYDNNPELKIRTALSNSLFRNANKGVVAAILRENIDKFQYGGIVGARRGGQLALIGEGRYNEAVVPLPNGRSIPVQIVGGNGNMGSKTYNISINIDGQSTSASNDKLRRAIEDWALENQQPGGILA